MTLHLWGTGDDLADFQALARDLALEGQVLFEPERLSPAGAACTTAPDGPRRRRQPAKRGVRRLCCRSSCWSTSPSGYRTVAPRLEAIQHYFTEEMVTYYEPEDVESLAEPIVRLHSDPDCGGEPGGRWLGLPDALRMGAAGRRVGGDVSHTRGELI